MQYALLGSQQVTARNCSFDSLPSQVSVQLGKPRQGRLRRIVVTHRDLRAK